MVREEKTGRSWEMVLAVGDQLWRLPLGFGPTLTTGGRELPTTPFAAKRTLRPFCVLSPGFNRSRQE